MPDSIETHPAELDERQLQRERQAVGQVLEVIARYSPSEVAAALEKLHTGSATFDSRTAAETV